VEGGFGVVGEGFVEGLCSLVVLGLCRCLGFVGVLVDEDCGPLEGFPCLEVLYGV